MYGFRSKSVTLHETVGFVDKGCSRHKIEDFSKYYTGQDPNRSAINHKVNQEKHNKTKTNIPNPSGTGVYLQCGRNQEEGKK